MHSQETSTRVYMCMCMCVLMRVYMQVRMYVRAYACIDAHTHATISLLEHHTYNIHTWIHKYSDECVLRTLQAQYTKVSIRQ